MALRFIHTADWHLGQQFHGYDRDAEHAAFLDWLANLLAERQPDALLVAGDIFDSISPPASAQRRLYQFLARLRSTLPGLQILLIAGNHDSASRLEAPSDLLLSLGIHVVGTPARLPDALPDPSRHLIPLRNSFGETEAIVLAVPFLRPADVPSPADAHDPYLAGIQLFHQRLTTAAESLRQSSHPTAALLAMGHCHLAGGDESLESERRLIIGGSEALPPSTYPDALAYVALGHLHKPQSFDQGRIRYSGSPIPLSFSERNYGHRILEVEIREGRLAGVTPIPIPLSVPLLRIPDSGAAPLPRILDELSRLPEAIPGSSIPHPFLELHILSDAPDPTRRRRIDQALQGKAVRLARFQLATPQALPAQPNPSSPAPSLRNLDSLDPLALMSAAHRERHGTEPSDALARALLELVACEANTPSQP